MRIFFIGFTPKPGCVLNETVFPTQSYLLDRACQQGGLGSW